MLLAQCTKWERWSPTAQRKPLNGIRKLPSKGSLKLDPIPDVPLTVIASQKNLDDPEHGLVWDKLQHELTKLTHDSKYVVAHGSGHFVQVDRPEIVIDAVRDVLKRAAST